MYKKGTKLILKVDLENFTIGQEYEIVMCKITNDEFALIDDRIKIKFLSIDALYNHFYILTEPINDKSLSNDEKTLKNPKAIHYNLWLDTDSVDIIKAKLTEVEYIGALKYNILKYQLRLGKKDSIESDKEKIEDYKRELNSILESKKC